MKNTLSKQARKAEPKGTRPGGESRAPSTGRDTRPAATFLVNESVPFRRNADGQYEITAADLFCGAGGTSTGLVLAVEELEKQYGVKIRLDLVAVNHWDVAIATHSANHKFAHHKCSGLTGVDPRAVIPGYLDLLVASPECTHHSNARGGKPMNDQSRSSGADVVRWIRELRPSMVIIENVREYRTWGPLGKNNRPIKNRKGEYFQQFLADIRALGYATEDRLLNCADYGCPTTRTRLFVYCKRTTWTAPIVWPAPTHAKATKDLELVGGLPKWLTAREHVIDWQDMGQSIFNRKRPLSPNTMRRIEAGLKKFSGIDLGGYLVKLYGTSDASSADQPVPTVTGGGNHLGLAVPFQIRTDCTGGKTAGVRGIDDPAASVVGSGGLGMVDPQAFIVPQFSENPPRSVDAPVPTITTTSRGIGMAEPFIVTASHRAVIVPVTHPDKPGEDPATRTQSVEEPLKTVTGARRGEIGVARAFLVRYNGTSGPQSVEQPLGTLTAKDRYALLVTFTNGEQVLLDILFRMLRPRELARAQSFPDDYVFTGKTEDVVKQIGNAVPPNMAKALCKTGLTQCSWADA